MSKNKMDYFLVCMGVFLLVQVNSIFPPRKCKSVIFNVDGLVLNTEVVFYLTHSALLKEFNETFPRSLKTRIMGKRLANTSKLIVETLNLNISSEKYQSKFESLIKNRTYSVDFMPGALKVIRHLSLHFVPMAAVTSCTRALYDILTEDHNHIFQLFDLVVTGGDDDSVKEDTPAPDIFLTALDRFREDVTASQTLVFEDSPGGVMGARRAGMPVVMVPDPGIRRAWTVNATKVLNTLRDFQPQQFGFPPYC